MSPRNGMRRVLAKRFPTYLSIAPPRYSVVKPMVLPSTWDLSNSSLNVGRSVFQERTILRKALDSPGFKAAPIYLNSPHWAASALLAKEFTNASMIRCGPNSHTVWTTLEDMFTTWVPGPDNRLEIQYSYSASPTPFLAAITSRTASMAASSACCFSLSVLAFSRSRFNLSMTRPRRASFSLSLAFSSASFFSSFSNSCSNSDLV
ncbi:MAG: hypothetical protein BWY09_03033 [Candidatus Hydrogenedentes bacterium ADurb.Bin179]|nr:MAG: hypothetical protein BWY09_03033 [Candidatus Hydrogenedentes bacterium ADurb.Bin179]